MLDLVLVALNDNAALKGGVCRFTAFWLREGDLNITPKPLNLRGFFARFNRWARSSHNSLKHLDFNNYVCCKPEENEEHKAYRNAR